MVFEVFPINIGTSPPLPFRKGLCLKPKIYGYKSIFKKNNIRKINLDTEFNQDELDKNPPILHTIYRINLEYLDKYNRGGNPSLKFELKL